MNNMKLLINKKEYLYSIKRKNVKKINLSIKPNKEIIVSSSDEIPVEYIENLLIKKIKWIDNKINFFESNNSNKMKKFVSGEDFIYLGKHYRLSVTKGEQEIFIKDNSIVIKVKDKNNLSEKKQLVELWYKKQANQILNEVFDRACNDFKKYDLARPSLIIRVMKSRWGTYNSEKNRMTLNSELIKASKNCIEYVIAHELTHQKYKNHNKEFYNMLSMMIPDWEKRKKELDEEIQKYLS